MDDEEFGRLVPSDRDAERWCLGGAMRHPAAMTEVGNLLEPDDLVIPAHQVLYVTMVSLHAQGVPLDPVTLKAELEERGQMRAIGGRADYLFSLYELGGQIVPSAAVYHAELIREKAARRKVLEAGHRLVQLAADPAADLADLVTQAQADVARAMMASSALRNHAADYAMDAATFMARADDRTAAVIPGLLDHQDRAVLVGREGDGKTTLLRQMGVAAAAGLHPFVSEPIPPVRVLICDFENPPYLVKSGLRRLTAVADTRCPGWDKTNLRVIAQPGGADLTRASDVLRLSDAIRRAEPDMIIAGPIYKMYTDRGQGAEELHSQITHFWDQIRARYGPALLLEAHAPGSTAGGARVLRPLGSSIWMRWPEFGFALARSGKAWKLDRFRGDREEGRPWPERLMRNDVPAPFGWPWKATYAESTFQGELSQGEAS